MKLVFFTFYYPPDLCAGSFRANALVTSLGKKIADDDELHVITTQPNRYAEHHIEASDIERHGNTTIYRIHVPKHRNTMLSQMRTFAAFAKHAWHLCLKIQPDFLIGTTSRLMTGILTWRLSRRLKCQYFIDLRDIFSETIADIFARKNILLSIFVKRFFLFFDKKVLNNAVGVNVVSAGFLDYFKENGIKTTHCSFYPNGVDEQFIDFSQHSDKKDVTSVMTILYAGNIGSGQGLERIIPPIAKTLGKAYRFIIIGDGSTKPLLQQAIKNEQVDNVELLSPVGRDELIKYYQQTDMLFLHLNDMAAFCRVLPSKIFEYAALGKPIIAGLQGYSQQFLSDNVPYACTFSNLDSDAAIQCIKQFSQDQVDLSAVQSFVRKYARVSIMEKMSEHLMTIVKNKV